jgi:hypothetical protein
MTWGSPVTLKRVGAAAMVASTAIALTGCGSSGPSSSAAVRASTSSHPSGARHRDVRNLEVVHRAGGTVRAHGHNSEVGESGPPSVVNPCKLVSAKEVQALTGRSIARSIEAPQGPTCVYQPHGRAHEVTLAVSAISFRAASRRLSSVISLRIAGHAAYCGTIGTPIAYVSLAQGRVMSIGAPCPVAAAMAKTALARL